MKEQLISFETAKLAKEKGFDWAVNNMWVHNTTEPLDDEFYTKHFDKEINHNKFGYLSAPTQSLLQKWLREEHNIMVEISFDTVTFGYRLFNPFKKSDYFTGWTFELFEYEKALEEGLKEALKLIK